MEKLKNLFYILGFLLIAGVCIGNSFFITQGGLTIKSITSAGFVLIGVLGLIYSLIYKKSNLKFIITMVVGLFTAMLGDILLEINFIVGAIFFALGHIVFFISYCFLDKFKWIDLVPGAIVAIISVIIITVIPVFNFGGIMMEIVICCYAIIISLMLGKALSNFMRNQNLINIIILIGSLLFFISDFMLLLGNFGGILGTEIACLATYYPAEILLAISIIFTKNNKKNDE